jgi:Na+/proline symporter
MNTAIIFSALIVSAALYGAIAYWKSREIKTISDFFHISDSKRGSLSIVAGNLTLGTGLVYIASLAQKQAIFALVAPAGVLVGYLLLSRLVSVLSISDDTEQHDILDFACRETGGIILYKSISVLIALAYLVLIPLEIYVSSTLFASIFASENTELMAPLFGITIFAVVIAYSALGGLRGVVATDFVQLGFMGIMILIVLSGAAYFSDVGGDVSISLLPSVDTVSLILVVASTFLTAVATQFYNVINITVGNSFNSNDQRGLFKRTGIILFCVMLVLVAVGAFASNIGQSNFGSIDILLGKLGAIEGDAGSLLVFFIVFGMVAVLISSADSGFVAISHTVYEKIRGNSTRNNESGNALIKVRMFYVVALNAFAAIPLIYLFQIKPNIISVIVTAISPLTISAPLIASAALCSSKFGRSLLHKATVSLPVIAAVIYAWYQSIQATLNKSANDGYLVVIVGVISSLVFFAFDYFWSGRRSNKA